MIESSNNSNSNNNTDDVIEVIFKVRFTDTSQM